MKNTKTIMFVLLAISWLVATSLRGLLIPLLAQFEIADSKVLGFNATTIFSFVLGVVLFFVLNRHQLVVFFTEQVIEELKKVTWPDKEETVQSTIVVIGLTLFIATALGVYDYVWAEVTQMFLFVQG